MGSWAVKDRSVIKDLNGWSKFGIYILVFIPIGSWFAITYAARHITRRNKLGILVLIGLLSIGFSIFIFITTVTLAKSLFTQKPLEPINFAATQKPKRSTSTPWPTKTQFPDEDFNEQLSEIFTYPYSNIKCLPWSIIDSSYLNQDICVFGQVVNIIDSGQFALEFSLDSKDFKFLDVNYRYFPDVEIGDCIKARGIVRETVGFIYLSPFVDGNYTSLYTSPLPCSELNSLYLLYGQ